MSRSIPSPTSSATRISRELGIAVLDRDIQGPNGPSGLYFPLGIISAFNNPNYTPLSVTVADPTQTTLPPGVIGFGDQDPNTFEPILPPGATFATVLAGVDEFQVTTFVPGFFFTDANYDVRFDNIFVSVPEPTCGWLVMMGGLVLLRHRGRRSWDRCQRGFYFTELRNKKTALPAASLPIEPRARRGSPITL